jgi:23S rRNA (adenine2503-C2)-methyltransferase
MILDEHAEQLADLIRGMNAYVNLIPYNEVDENGYQTTNEKEHCISMMC